MVFIDGLMVGSTVIDDVIDYEFDGYLSLGDQFNGAIKSIKVLNHAYCTSVYAESISFSTTDCPDCSFCDVTDSCYIDCLSLEGYYIDTTTNTCEGKFNNC